MILPPWLAAWRLYLELAVAGGLLVLAGWMWAEKNIAVVELANEKTAFANFKAQQSEGAARQARDVLAKYAAAVADKEKFDAENKRLRGMLADAARRLRESNPPITGGSGAAARPDSKCPDGQLCFDRAEYVRADGEFVAEARAIADECTALIADLDVAKLWAQKRRKSAGGNRVVSVVQLGDVQHARPMFALGSVRGLVAATNWATEPQDQEQSVRVDRDHLPLVVDVQPSVALVIQRAPVAEASAPPFEP